MELRHLRAFVAIVEAGGVARAGARLNVSQPALSRQILALEDHLVRRFVEERQILASIEHPRIARLLDGGITSAYVTPE